MRSRALFDAGFFAFVLAGLPACAQVVEATVPRVGQVIVVAQRPGVPGMSTMGGISASLALSGVVPAPTLPSPVALQTAALAPAAASPKTSVERSQRLEVVSQSIAPALEALQNPSLGAGEAKAAGQIVMDQLLGADGAGASAVPGVYAAGPPSGKGSRSQPVVSQVSYAEGVSARQRKLFDQTLRRRRTGWDRGLAKMGVKLQGSAAPVLIVKSAEDHAPKMAAAVSEVRYIVEWFQTPTRLGAFKVAIRLRDMRTVFSRWSTPPAAEDKQIRIRLRRTVIAKDFPVEIEVTQAMIEEFFEARGLRVLGKQGEATWLVAVTGGARADVVARELSGQGLVLFATPVKGDIPESSQLRAVFKQKTISSARVETAVDDGAIAETLREAGLLVLENAPHEPWKLGAYDGVPAAAAAAKLAASGIVLYAVPLRFEAAEDRQVVVEFTAKVLADLGGMQIEASVSEDDIARVLTAGGLTVVGDYGSRSYRLQAPAGTSGRDALATLLASKLVKKGVVVGELSDGLIRGAAQGAAGMKGRPWSSTEYNANLASTRANLELGGATQSQLELFDRLADDAPTLNGGFNPWSGD